MKSEDIKKLAKAKADGQEIKGSSAWNALYYGYIFGFQDAQKLIKNTKK